MHILTVLIVLQQSVMLHESDILSYTFSHIVIYENFAVQ